MAIDDRLAAHFYYEWLSWFQIDGRWLVCHPCLVEWRAPIYRIRASQTVLPPIANYLFVKKTCGITNPFRFDGNCVTFAYWNLPSSTLEPHRVPTLSLTLYHPVGNEDHNICTLARMSLDRHRACQCGQPNREQCYFWKDQSKHKLLINVVAVNKLNIINITAYFSKTKPFNETKIDQNLNQNILIIPNIK